MIIKQCSDVTAAEQRIIDSLDAAAVDAGHPFRMEVFFFEAYDGETYLGGLQAKAGLAWVFVNLLAVTPAARGRGVGSRLLAEAEKIARDQGLHGVWLDTFAFQAPAFYTKLGYQEFGRLSGAVPPETRHFFAKRLSPDATASIVSEDL